jgi:hypothetical protein
VTAKAMPMPRGHRFSVWQTRDTDPAGEVLGLVTQTQPVT